MRNTGKADGAQLPTTSPSQPIRGNQLTRIIIIHQGLPAPLQAQLSTCLLFLLRAVLPLACVGPSSMRQM